MTRHRIRILPLVTSLSLLMLLLPPAGRAQAADPGPGTSRPELQAVMDSLTSDTATGFLAEVIDERGRWVGTSGVADLEKRRPVPWDGQFRVGSVTKSFVATVVLQLVGEGRLSLDDTVEKWLPGVVPGGDRIAVRQLLNHTSGIFNYTDDPETLPLAGERFLENRFHTFTPLDLVKIATAHPPNFPPGSAWSYSNTNYILAGLIVEKVTRHPWSTEVSQRIIEPLGLRHTELPGTSQVIRGPHSHGYTILYDGRKVRTVDITEFNQSAVGAAGEIVSTTDDLLRFYAALFGGRLLHPAELAAMTTTVDAVPGFRYGLGVFQMTLPCGVTIWGHNGGMPGYLTTVYRSEDGKRQLATSVNPILDRAALHMNDLVLAEFCGRAALHGQGSMPMRAAAAIR